MSTIVEPEKRIIARSALRHRPIGHDTCTAAPRGEKTVILPPVTSRASRSADTVGEVVTWKHTIREDTAIPTQKTRRTRRTITTKQISRSPRSRKTRSTWMPRRQKRAIQAHPLLSLGLGMLGMLTLWVLLSGLVNWVSVTSDDIHYGRPRTFQIDAWVGHNEQTGVRSHFIALNLHRRIEIIEIAGGDAAQTRIYSGPQLYGANDDLVPVTLEFLDVNGDHKPDMLVHFQNTRMVYINDQGGFRPLRPNEQSQVEQFLDRLGR